ncbi:agmatine deiminase family protein [Streptomyces sp. NBC_01565]|uniref:agmatine deiminase family protein n=1 Tax=Streptomyces sp. NBC_01565 TaxID=2975881 RepID=UPI002258F4E7|nr:agmatine deiminase family protein [Streptomyces sp. NBC_01565]MCX4539818.1 agmatine deiminase family protein [Streptomyces sp. NBC_01565]
MTEINERRKLDRRGFLAAAGLTAAGAALAAVGGEAFAATRPTTRPAALPAAAAGGFAVPVDTVRHTRTWMAWPDSSAIWGRQLAGVQSNIALIAKTVAKYEPVVMCANPAAASKARSACGPAVTVITSIPVDDCWMRDSGPVFRTNGAGGLDAVGLNFNGWGNQQTHAKDSLVAGRVAAYASVPFSTAGFIGEGGAVETDGAGTLMATRSSILNPDRNPNRTQAQVEAAMCAAFGASKVIWFQGVLGRDITDDHVDATSRFLSPGQGTVQMPLPGDNDAWSKDARQQYQILSTSTTAQGGPISVTKLQGPDYDLIRSGDPNFVAAYANYYVCNGAVISSQFGDSRADAAAKSTLQRLFPGRTVEQLNTDSLGAGGGGIHCVTQQQPVP